MTSRIGLACVALLTVLLGGCASSTHDSSAQIPSTAAAGKVEVQVYTLQRTALPNGSTVHVRLVDATDSGKIKIISEDSLSTRSQPPYAFTLKFKPSAIESDHVYQVLADLTQPNGTKWSQLRLSPVLTGGAPAYIEVPVGPR